MDFCLRSCATPEWKTWRNWYTEHPGERAACVDCLFLKYRSWAYNWYRGPMRNLRLFHAPILIALHSFVSEQKGWKTTWSLGQALDLAVLFGTLQEFSEGWDREEAQHMAGTLRPYALNLRQAVAGRRGAVPEPCSWELSSGSWCTLMRRCRGSGNPSPG